MKKQSKRINDWGNASTVLGILSIAIGLFAASLDATWGAGLAAAGLGLLVYAPLLNGFAILVKNAEDQIEERENKQQPPQTLCK
jgi:hypothetical protein